MVARTHQFWPVDMVANRSTDPKAEKDFMTTASECQNELTSMEELLHRCRLAGFRDSKD